MGASNGGYLSAADIAAAADREYADYDVPEWGGKVRLSGLPALEGMEFTVLASQNKLNEVQMIRVLAMSLVDANGALLYGTVEAGVKALAGKAFAPINRLWPEVLKLSGLQREAAAELGKASETTLPGGSSTA